MHEWVAEKLGEGMWAWHVAVGSYCAVERGA